jgi:hypothetical protein
MKKEVIRYEVLDKKGRWMGGYSVSLSKPPLCHPTSAKEMAIINADHSQGKVYEVYNTGESVVVYPIPTPS